MNPDVLAAKLRDLRAMGEHALARRASYVRNSEWWHYWDGRKAAIDDVLRTFENDLEPLDLCLPRHSRVARIGQEVVA